jgi:adenylyltransferase/sulfurtransferase
MDAVPEPDYSRQILLKEIGIAGQQKLAASRVLVVGAGGLGSPVLQYLAGAGVGRLDIVEADELDTSNLHRQPLYSLAEVGLPKAELARTALARLNPRVRVDVHRVRFSTANAAALVRDVDVVVDCSDNFTTKFLINDAAVLAHKPAVFASVYQYEGQLQVYQPRQDHACLRCLWPEGSIDGVVGNCAEAGVLGPVPGAFGTLQALLTLKVLLGMPGQLAGELLLLDLSGFSLVKLKAKRRAECRAPDCALIREISPVEDDLSVQVSSLEDARRQGFEPVDIRTDAELVQRPAAARHIAMPELLANPQRLAAGGRYLLVCATGKRSLAAARALQGGTYTVRSLAGGLENLNG